MNQRPSRPSSSRRSSSVRAATTLAAAALVAACAGGGSGPAGTAGPDRAGAAEWEALATPRPTPLAGAARVSVGEIRILASGLTAPEGGVGLALGLQELVSVGLIRRRDVHFVERRRFAEAAARERAGGGRPAGAPAAGVSPGVEYVATAAWASVGLDSAYVDVRLAEAATGDVVATWRGATANDADVVAVGRRVVVGILGALDELGRRPAWSDPVAAAAPASYGPSGVPPEAAAAFFRGLAAEEEWAWERARVAYQRAAEARDFPEAAAALARAARLRTGGTLGES